MSAEAMLACYENSDPERRLQLQVAAQCAPVLKGVKASNLISGRAGTWRQVEKHLKGCRVICALLYADGRREVLFLYRYDLLEQHLKKTEVREFLKKAGYKSPEIGPVLKRLRLRYQRYAGAGRTFPHELGILLEYPVEDVKGFISNRGKNSLVSGYWKVYGDRERAEQIFRLYDQAREAALTEVAGGYPLAQVALS